MTVNELANMTIGRTQSNATSLDYPLPKSYAYLYKIGRYMTEWKREIPKRNTYVDKIFTEGKKPEAGPGVGQYSPNPIVHNQPRETSQKIGKESRVTTIDKIAQREKNRPSPQTYRTDQAFQQKVHGVYLGQNKSPQSGLTGEYEYFSNETPSC
jgi:hypothetical protein